MTLSTNAPIALITGASRGIGLEVSRQLGTRGYRVLVGARDMDKAEAATNSLHAEGIDAQPLALDVTATESVEQARANVEARYGKLDVLVNNAAAYVDWRETASNANIAHAHDVFETNVFGAWRMIQAFLPLLRVSEAARIVNVSSGAGSHSDMQFGLTTGSGGVASYGVSKAALNALTSKFAAELAGSNILVNAVCPGLTATYPGAEAMGARPIADGAAGIVWAATLPQDGPTGGFWRDGTALGW